MDIAGLSMNLAMINTQNDVGTAVLANALDNAEIAGDGIVKMIGRSEMEASVNPNVGTNIDIYV